MRRDCIGELIQIDGSDHRWSEDWTGPCALLVFIDDATSTLMELLLVKELRLAGISEMEAANDFLPVFTDRYNAKFANPAVTFMSNND